MIPRPRPITNDTREAFRGTGGAHSNGHDTIVAAVFADATFPHPPPLGNAPTFLSWTATASTLPRCSRPRTGRLLRQLSALTIRPSVSARPNHLRSP